MTACFIRKGGIEMRWSSPGRHRAAKVGGIAGESLNSNTAFPAAQRITMRRHSPNCRDLAKPITLLASIVLSTAFPAFGQDRPQASKPLAMRDIARMRHDRVPAKTIVQRASDQGVDFKVTPGIEKQLARLGFDADQIDAVRQAWTSSKSLPAKKPHSKTQATKSRSPKRLRPKSQPLINQPAISPRGEPEKAPPIVPGEGLPSGEEQRKSVYDVVAKIAKLSGLNLPSVETRHFTLWASKADQARFLPEMKKIENYLEQNHAEPLRSGLDKRSAHLVVLKTRYEYEKWINAMHDEVPETFKLADAPGHDDMKAAVLKSSSFYTREVAVLCLAEQDEQWLRRMAAADIGDMNFTQQVQPGRHDPLATGFANVVEALAFGQPRVMMYSNSYYNDNRELGKDTAGLAAPRPGPHSDEKGDRRAVLAGDGHHEHAPAALRRGLDAGWLPGETA